MDEISNGVVNVTSSLAVVKVVNDEQDDDILKIDSDLETTKEKVVNIDKNVTVLELKISNMEKLINQNQAGLQDANATLKRIDTDLDEVQDEVGANQEEDEKRGERLLREELVTQFGGIFVGILFLVYGGIMYYIKRRSPSARRFTNFRMTNDPWTSHGAEQS